MGKWEKDGWATRSIEEFMPPREPTIEDWKSYAHQLEDALEKKRVLLEEARNVAREVVGGFSETGLIRRGLEASYEWLSPTPEVDCCEDETNENTEPVLLDGEGHYLGALRTHLDKEARKTRGIRAWEP